MKNAPLGDLVVSRIGLGAMTMAGTYTTGGPLTTPSRSAPSTGPSSSASPTSTPPRSTGPSTAKKSSDGPSRAAATRWIATKFGLVPHHGDSHLRHGQQPREHLGSGRGLPAAPRHRLHRPLLPAPCRPEHVDRGDRGSRRRPHRRRQGAPLRTLRGRAGHDPPGTRRATGHRASDRVLPVDPRRGGRDPAAAARARHRLRALLTSRTRPAHRADPHRRRLRRRRLAQDEPPVHRRQLPRNLAIVDEVTAIGAEIGATPAQTALAWLLTRGHDIAPIPGTRRVARVEENTAADTSSSPPTSSSGWTRSSPPPANGTTKPTWPPSTADITDQRPSLRRDGDVATRVLSPPFGARQASGHVRVEGGPAKVA